MRMLPVTLLVLFLCTSASADTLKTETDLRPFSDRVMAALVKGGIASAFAEMKPYAVVSGPESDAVALTSQAQWDQFGARYGKTVGYEFIGQKKRGDSLIRLTYVQKTEKHALPWTFYFYKTPAGWVLNLFQWNDQTQLLFQAGD